MQTTVPLYNFGGGSGGTGGTLNVTAPAGVTVTVSKDGKSKTKVADSSGAAAFQGLATGAWTLTITDGSQTAQKTVTITADYSATIKFFSATINVTYPAGSTCTATDGVTTLAAPDTSGTWACEVPNVGTWTVSLDSGFAETVTVTEDGQTQTIDKWYLYNQGDEYTECTGGWSNSGYSASNYNYTAPTKLASGMQLTNTALDIPGAGTANAMEVAGFTRLVIEIESTNAKVMLGITGSKSAAGTAGATANITVSAAGVHELDISGVSDAQYVFFNIPEGKGTAIVTSVYLA